MSDTIVSRLQSQRVLLVDMLRQVDTAIAAFGGTVTANGNGNGATPTETRGSWWKHKTPAQKARIMRKIRAAKRAKRAERAAAPAASEF